MNFDPLQSSSVQAVVNRMQPGNLHKIAGAMYGIGEVNLRSAVLHLCTKMAHDHLRAMRVQYGLESLAALSTKQASGLPTVSPRAAREAFEAARNAAAHAPTPAVSAVSGLPRYGAPAAALPAMSHADKLQFAMAHNIPEESAQHISHFASSPFDWKAKPLPIQALAKSPAPAATEIARKARPTLDAQSNDLALIQDFHKHDMAAGGLPKPAAAAPKRFNLQDILTGKTASYTLEEILSDNVKLASFIQAAKNLGTAAMNAAKPMAQAAGRGLQQAAHVNPTGTGAAIGAGIGALGGAAAGGEGNRMSGALAGAGLGAGLGAAGGHYAGARMPNSQGFSQVMPSLPRGSASPRMLTSNAQPFSTTMSDVFKGAGLH